ncbi:MAG: DUF167 domain-containing protein [Nanoarchaeota archaeon]|nr:DUF167 domain-containing protein [Nanoarchaeota archaeon]
MNFEKNELYSVRVKVNSSKSGIVIEDDKIIVYLHSIPINNKANEELVKLFKKELKLKVEIIKGLKSRNKIIKIL